MAAKQWRCSQCGTINEPGTRACSACGKWPSLFDLQDSVVEEEAEPAVTEDEVFMPETFEPEVFQPEAPEDGEEEGKRRGRIPRWLVTAIWISGIAIWILVNALGDRG